MSARPFQISSDNVAPNPKASGGSVWPKILPVLLLLWALTGAFYIVQETEQCIITQFGRPVGDPIVTPGLKVKLPGDRQSRPILGAPEGGM